MNENENILYETFNSIVSKLWNECSKCVHKDICKIKEKEGIKEKNCEYYQHDLDVNIYSNIYELFDPIFDWIKIHYPVGDIKFLVDNNSAKMLLEHGAFVVDKSLRNSINNNKEVR